MRSSSQWYLMSQDLENFGLTKDWTMPNPVFLLVLGVFLLSDCGLSMAIRVYHIGTISCPWRKIPPVSASTDEAITCLSVWHMVRMEMFSFGLGVSLLGRRLLR